MTAEALDAGRILEPGPADQIRRRVFGHAGFMFGAIVIAIMLAMALLAPLLAPHDPYDQDLARDRKSVV